MTDGNSDTQISIGQSTREKKTLCRMKKYSPRSCVSHQVLVILRRRSFFGTRHCKAAPPRVRRKQIKIGQDRICTPYMIILCWFPCKKYMHRGFGQP
jgi:hypothetical protein